MNDYRTMYDRNFLYAFDLKGREVTVEIVRVEAGKLQSPGSTKKTSKPIVFFKGREKGPGLALNKTNGKAIAKLYGNDADQWVGKLVTIYPTTTKFGAETVDCIRVRPNVPRGKPETAPDASMPPHEPPGEEGTDGRQG